MLLSSECIWPHTTHWSTRIEVLYNWDCVNTFVKHHSHHFAPYEIYIYINIEIVKNVSFFRCSAAAKYFAAKILYPQLIFAAALLNFAAILLSTEGNPNSCGPMADGPFRNPKGQSYPHPQILDPSMKYWYQYRPWNLTHRITLKNQCIWHIIQRHYYHIAAAQWRMVNFGIPRVGPIHTPNIGPIDERLISISVMEFHP